MTQALPTIAKKRLKNSSQHSRPSRSGVARRSEHLAPVPQPLTNKNLSSSNVRVHYQTHHKSTHDTLVRLHEQNATDKMLENVIAEQKSLHNKSSGRVSIRSFFRPSASGESRSSSAIRPQTCEVPVKVLQAVTLVLHCCLTETPISRSCTPITQSFVDICNGRLQFSSKEPVEAYLVPTYNAVCGLLRSSVSSALTGSIALDGWSAASGAPILGVTWHYIDGSWKLQTIPVTTLHLGTASKTGEQLRCIVEELLQQSSIIGSDKIRVHTATSDNEASAALAVDLLTNYVGSVRCIVHSMALVMKD
eukprot:IDg1466t1